MCKSACHIEISLEENGRQHQRSNNHSKLYCSHRSFSGRSIESRIL